MFTACHLKYNRFFVTTTPMGSAHSITQQRAMSDCDNATAHINSTSLKYFRALSIAFEVTHEGNDLTYMGQ
jgi:hypothetical protein